MIHNHLSYVNLYLNLSMFSVRNCKKFIPSTKRLFKTSAKERRSNPIRLTALIYLSPFRCATDVERSSCKFLRNFTCRSASEILRCLKTLSSNDMPHKRLGCRKCKKKNLAAYQAMIFLAFLEATTYATPFHSRSQSRS